MSRSTHQLKHEHRVIEKAMRALEGICLRLRAGGPVPDTEMSKLLDFIRNFINDCHHKKEETFLFPALAKIGIRDENGTLGFLHSEHATERRLLDVLEQSVEAYRGGDIGAEQFASAALAFRDHLIGHMEHEEAILFRLAEEMLGEEDRDALFGCLTEESAARSEYYEQLATELEEAWAV